MKTFFTPRALASQYLAWPRLQPLIAWMIFLRLSGYTMACRFR